MADDMTYNSKTQVMELLESNRAGVGIDSGRLLASELFCRKGHPLISPDNPRFDDKPGIKILADANGKKQLLCLSPFEKDSRKKGEFLFTPGQLLKLLCPECGDEFPRVAPHDCHEGAMYVALFMRPDGNVQKSVCLCNAWDCYSSFTKLFNEVITDLRRYTPKPLL